MPDATPEGAPPALWSRHPRVRGLSVIQAEFILARNHVGQVSFVARDRAELLPLHYVYRDGSIVSRTSFGPKTAAWAERPDVVFGVEESDGLFDWRSVIVRGTVRILSPHGSRHERTEYWRTVEILRSLIPESLTERDPTPERRVVFRISPEEISGREASTGFLSRAQP